MRVLHVITGLGVGGAEQQLRLLLRHLPPRITCDVLTLTNPGPVAAGLRADGHRVGHLHMGGNTDLRALPRLVAAIRAGRYDLVHTHLYRACLYGRPAARAAGVRAVVATEHSLGAHAIEGRPLTRGTRGLYLATERLGSATVAVSHTVAARLRAWGVDERRLHVVPNGIDAAAFRFDPAARAAVRARLGLPTGAVVVGGVGRLVPGKRFDVLVRVCAALPGVRLLLAGDGPERGALRALAARLGSSGRVHLAGERPAGELAGLLCAMDVFVSPSDEEAFGLSAVEAMAAGLPVLHVTCPAVDELPSGQAPGARRVPAGEAALTAALRQRLADGTERLPVPAAVHRYDISRTAGALADLYDRALGTAPRRPRAARPVPVRTPVRTEEVRSS